MYQEKKKENDDGANAENLYNGNQAGTTNRTSDATSRTPHPLGSSIFAGKRGGGRWGGQEGAVEELRGGLHGDRGEGVGEGMRADGDSVEAAGLPFGL